jgi:hypothetical protein
VIITIRGRDVILLEDPVGPRFTAYSVGGEAGQMGVVLGWHTYAAAFTNRQPSAIGVLTGSGLAVPSGF